MKKIIIFAILVLFLSPLAYSVTIGYEWEMSKVDSVLVNLLNVSHNDPFFGSTKRQNAIQDGLALTSATLPLSGFRQSVTFAADSSAATIPYDAVTDIVGAIRFSATDSAYSLIEISGASVGQKEIATDAPGRYYWQTRLADGTERLYIYPPLQAQGTILVCGLRMYNAFDDSVRSMANPEILYYSLYRLYQQKGETSIASAFKQLYDMMVADLQNNLLNRPIDITHPKRILAK